MELHARRSFLHSAHGLARRIRAAVLALSLMLATVPVAGTQQTATPEPAPFVGPSRIYEAPFSNQATYIDGLWSGIFIAGGIVYGSPDLVVLEHEVQTGCGTITADTNTADTNVFYCPQDRSLYLVPQDLSDLAQRFGDYAPKFVLSHEWGHHLQNLLKVTPPTRKAAELQADCVAGAFARYEKRVGHLEGDDLVEAIKASLEFGDLLAEDDPQAHGSAEERVSNLLAGYNLGVANGCQLPLSVNESIPEGTATPTGEPIIDISDLITNYLPPSLPLTHADCFRVERGGALSFEQFVERFPNPEDAATRLRTLGWQATAYRRFACDTPTNGEAGRIEVWLYAFAHAETTREAVDFLAAARSEGAALKSFAAPSLADYAVALSGPADPGEEYTLYASQGQYLVRVIGVSPSGIPASNVLTVVQTVLETLQVAPRLETPQVEPESVSATPVPVSATPVPAPSLPASAYLPPYPQVNYRECFGVIALGLYGYEDIVDALSATGLTLAEIDHLGWQDGAYSVFSCPSPPLGRASQLDVVIQRFGDAQAAEQALPSVDATYVPGTNESRRCSTLGSLIVCVTGQSLSGQPQSDVQLVLDQVLAASG